MARVFVGVGSNIEPYTNIPAALRMLARQVECLQVSGFYETLPIGSAPQPSFVNGVFLIRTQIGPRELKFDVFRGIESGLGRVRTADKFAPRTIDLDIVLYDNLVINEPDLVVPDPDLMQQAFLAVPAAEVDPDMIIPNTALRLGELAKKLGSGGMRRLDEFTKKLRMEL